MKNIPASVALATACWASVALADDSRATVEAQSAAGHWLDLIDAGQFGVGWEKASAAFKAGITKQQWEEAARQVRAPLGAVTKRAIKSAVFSNTLPGAPDGPYVVVQYETQFTNKANALETVTPVKGSDGVWRVSGYFVK